LALRESQSITRKPSDPPDWLSGRATQPCGSPQIGSTGSQGEPINPAEAFKSVRLALRESHSTLRKPSNASEWLSGRATQPCGSLQIGPTGSQEEPFNPVEALKSVRLALRESQSTLRKPSNQSDWLSGRATQPCGSLQIGPTGSQEEPIDHTEALKSVRLALRKSHVDQDTLKGGSMCSFVDGPSSHLM
jgi:hypothetical protein